MTERREYSPFDRYNDRWPSAGDCLFSVGRDARLAQNAPERSFRFLRGYKRAGDVLIDNIFGDPADHDDLVYPIVYCYRHYIELALKSLVEDHGAFVSVALNKIDHDLRELWKLFLQIAQAYANDPNDDAAIAVGSCIEELVAIDGRSTTFRYPHTRTGQLIKLSDDGIDLTRLRDVMNGIENFFECADLDFQHKREAALSDWPG